MRDMTGKTILIDVGGKVDFDKNSDWSKRVKTSNAERTLVPYLNSRGVSKIDILVLTHTDTDHVGDIEIVANHFKIGEIWTTKGSMGVSEYVSRLKKINLPVHIAEVGEKIPIFHSNLQVLYPSEIGDGGNNDSLVLYGKLLGTRFLFTGDLESDGEDDLMANYPNLQVDILKAGHHGSKGSTSEKFLESLKPKIALLSVGKNNRYQHPHQETLDRLDKYDVGYYRTDEQGAIRFTGWNSWKIETAK